MRVDEIEPLRMGVHFQGDLPVAGGADDLLHVHVAGLALVDQPPAGVREDAHVRIAERLDDPRRLPGPRQIEIAVDSRYHDVDLPQHRVGQIEVTVLEAQNRVATSLGELPTPGFTTYDLRSYWLANEYVVLTAGVENFTDKFYREHLDVRAGNVLFQKGINFYFGLQLQY